ncbi:hypothetical protein CK203_084890 [Vitis vinifera]|uniref:Uncharacterized protein n=1 Tax=Vitis vinifera TaxID=29760 RepID=A0A438BT50_VITVI|nr:hypothetical protein CK203_084890 [Vitis vinifera]
MTLRISPEIHFVIYPIHASSSYHTHSALKETHPPSHALLPDVTPHPTTPVRHSSPRAAQRVQDQVREKDKESRETESGGDMEALVGGGRMVSGCSVGEGLCMERCAGGAQDNAIINRIMLRFRPIAPKPAAGGSSSGGSTSENRNVVVARGRGKRKYVRVRKYNRCRRKKRTAEEEIREGLEKTVQTLQLLPEKADGSDSPAGASWCNLERSETTKPIRETATLLAHLQR